MFFDQPGVGFAGLPALAGDGHSLLGISGAAATLNRSFITTDTGQSTYLPFTFPGQVNQSFPTGISRDGSVVSGWDTHTSSSIQVGWRWSASGGMQVLPFRVAGAMSGDGSTIFSLNDSPTRVWRNGTITTLPVGSGAISTVNYDGSVYAGVSTLGLTIWHHDVPTGVPMLPGMAIGSFTDVDETGSVAVGTMSDGTALNVPFIWTPSGGTQPRGAYFASYGYDLSGYRIFNAHVSDDGWNFALGATPLGSGTAQGIIVTIPCPATLGVLVGLFASARRTR